MTGDDATTDDRADLRARAGQGGGGEIVQAVRKARILDEQAVEHLERALTQM